MMVGISEMVAQAGTKAREIAKGLVPTVLETQGLAGALRELAQQKREMFGVNCIAAVTDEDRIERLPDSISIQLFRIAQEAVANAIKHSDAEVIEMSLRAHDGRLELRIRDDGKGMARDRASNGMGLMTMQRRAELIEADFSVQASPGGGTYIRCIVPLMNHE
jgi:signal transduction histidine kinase